MIKYRKKPVIIEVIVSDGTPERNSVIINWTKGSDTPACMGKDANDIMHLYINTLEGAHLVSDGDYIIKGFAGEFYPCKPGIFEATYEIVE